MRIGILGCGQLARMLSLAALPLGIETLSLTADPKRAHNGITPVFQGCFESTEDLHRFGKQVDAVTFETENIPLSVAETLAEVTRVLPNMHALKHCQDRLFEKRLFQSLNIDTAPYVTVDSLAELQHAVAQLNLPAILKTRRMGYDGKGQFLLREMADIEIAWQALGGQALILEGFVRFDRELSQIAVRDPEGNCRYYSLTENQHRHGILYLSKAPFIESSLQERATHYITTLLDHLDYVGVVALELFQCGNTLIANEMAPRVHNSGHWTIEGAVTSQFANHIRAIAGLPLGDTSNRGFSAMINCVGSMPPIAEVLKYPGVHYHDYQKEARPDRKVGHVTLNTVDETSAQQQLSQLLKYIAPNREYTR